MTFPGVYINTLEYSKSIDPEHIDATGFEDIYVDTDFGNIHGVWFDAGKEKTVYYFHGSGGDVRFFYNEMRRISLLGFNVLALEYPGYGKSTWFPYEENVYQATKALYKQAQQQFNFQDEKVYVWGYSVWTAIALEFAGYKNIAGVILLAPYSSRYSMTKSEFGLVWQKWIFLEDSMKSKDYIETLDMPILIAHGKKDTILDFADWKALTGFWNENIQFIGIDEWNHYNLLDFLMKDTQFLHFLQKK